MSREKACQRLEKFLGDILPKNAEFIVGSSTKQLKITIFPCKDEGKGIHVEEPLKLSNRKEKKLRKDINKSIFER